MSGVELIQTTHEELVAGASIDDLKPAEVSESLLACSSITANLISISSIMLMTINRYVCV